MVELWTCKLATTLRRKLAFPRSKSTPTRVSYAKRSSYNQIGNSSAYCAELVSVSFKRNKRSVRRKYSLRRWEGRRKINLQYSGMSIPLVKRFFFRLGLLYILCLCAWTSKVSMEGFGPVLINYPDGFTSTSSLQDDWERSIISSWRGRE